jgi:hypothetical protein
LAVLLKSNRSSTTLAETDIRQEFQRLMPQAWNRLSL